MHKYRVHQINSSSSTHSVFTITSVLVIYTSIYNKLYILVLFSDLCTCWKNLATGSPFMAEVTRKGYMAGMQPAVGTGRIWVDGGVGRAFVELATGRSEGTGRACVRSLT